MTHTVVEFQVPRVETIGNRVQKKEKHANFSVYEIPWLRSPTIYCYTVKYVRTRDEDFKYFVLKLLLIVLHEKKKKFFNI